MVSLISAQVLMLSKPNQTNYIIVCLKVDQSAGQLSLPHLGITKT